MNQIEAPSGYRYADKKRWLPAETGWREENDAEFMLRMKDAQDVLWCDLERADEMLPIFDDLRRQRKFIKDAMLGIAMGGKFKEVLHGAGFTSWGEFESQALNRARCVRILYQLARAERDFRRMSDAEDALHERAVDGVQEPIINHLGQVVGYKTKYSDSLLALELRSMNPEKYGERRSSPTEGMTVNIQMDLGTGQPSGEKPAEEVELERFNGLDGLIKL